MPRKYAAVRVVGRLEHQLQKIVRMVQSFGLTDFTPIIRYERRPKSEFYIFMAVDNWGGSRIPPSIRDALKKMGYSGFIDELMDFGQIRSIAVGGELETQGVNLIGYRSLWMSESLDPATLYEPGADNDVSLDGADDEEDRHNRLLAWASATGDGSWDSFSHACVAIGLARDPKGAGTVLRRMALLGHIESAADGSRWAACPTTLVEAANGEYWFLSGRTTASVISQLNQLTEASRRMETTPQPAHRGPTSYHIERVPAKEIFSLGQPVQAGRASLRLANALPDWRGWEDSLTHVQKPTIPAGRVEVWNGRDYVASNQLIEVDARYEGPSGMYNLSYGDVQRPRTHVLFFDHRGQRFLRGDWYGLRFLAQKASNERHQAIYNGPTGDMVVPADCRWPSIYERALVLASGVLPSIVDNNGARWLKYRGVTKELAILLTTKLEVELGG